MSSSLSTQAYVLPVLLTIFLWWFSTGIVLLLNGLPRSTFRWSFAVATILGGLALFQLTRSTPDESTAAVYASFLCGLMVWGWNEMGFLMGFITGPRRTACQTGCAGWAHALHAVQAILYHELSIAASACLLIAVSWEGPNRAGMWTFLLLWVMRISAKLNVFLGVRNLSEEFLPDYLRYLESFFRRRPMNPLMPASILLAGALTCWLVWRALAPDITPPELTQNLLLATLAGLALIEHGLMVLPIQATRLWRWSLGSRRSSEVLRD